MSWLFGAGLSILAMTRVCYALPIGLQTLVNIGYIAIRGTQVIFGVDDVELRG